MVGRERKLRPRCVRTLIIAWSLELRAYSIPCQSSNIDLNVTVLTSTFWPGEGTATTCVFPPALTTSMQEFTRFYHDRHSGRRLTWQSNHGTADVRVTFKARKHELNVSTHCLIILLLFENLEDGEELSLQVSTPGYHRRNDIPS